MLPGIANLFEPGTTEHDFDVTDNNQLIQNNKDLKFQPMKLEGGKTVTPDIAKENFSLSVEDTEMLLSMSRTHYEYSPGINVYAQFDSWSTVDFSPEVGYIDVKNVKTDSGGEVEKESWVVWTEVFSGIALSVLGAAVGTAVGKAFCTEAELADQTATSGRMSTVSISSGAAFAAAGPDGAAIVESEALQSGASELEANLAGELGEPQSFSGMIIRNWKKILGGMIGAGAGAAVGAIPDYLELIAAKNPDKVPKLQTFVSTAVTPICWTDGKDFKLKSARLNRSLQLGGDMTFD